MTEDKAKTRWCPFVRIDPNQQFGAYNPPNTRCRGSDCMAWRLGTFEETGTPDETQGYCGLAGKP